MAEEGPRAVARVGPLDSSSRTLMARIDPGSIAHKSLFVGLDRHELSRLAEIGISRSFQPGEIITQENQPGTSLYVILTGEVEIVLMRPSGDTQQLTTLVGEGSFLKQYEGDFFGEMSLLDAEPRSATVKAVTECSLLEFPNTGLRDVFTANRNIQLVLTMNIARTLSRRLRESNRRLESASR